MNEDKKPIREYSLDHTLGDGVEVIVRGEVFEDRLFPGGDEIFSRIVILNKLSNIALGVVFYEVKLSETELKDKVLVVAENPNAALFQIYKSQN